MDDHIWSLMGGIFKNNHITLFACFTFIPKTGVGIPKTNIHFDCDLVFWMKSLFKIQEKGALRDSTFSH